MTDKRPIRCAIYTRKSSEEGLEQSFNSLHAQREACEAYIASQKHEGWHAVSTRYDDGGFSGGTMERPALQQLLEDIGSGKINTVVVYKVDRLTRSLMDFSRIIEAFDAKGVCFVSVTQQFNTTTSMGRLTLNVLLSFAQFEREVTGERIRDKVAASKKKGMWMGGWVPVGYDLHDRHLIVNAAEAEIIRVMFQQYLRLGRVSQLRRYLQDKKIYTKVRPYGSGEFVGGKPYSRGALYQILKNRLYLGEIAHKGNVYPGQHEAIIDQETWDQTAALLAQNNRGNRQRGNSTNSSLLTGIIFDAAGNRYTPTHAIKKGKRYRYYTSQAVIRGRSSPTTVTRIPAIEIERVVESRMKALLSSPAELNTLFTEAGTPATKLRDGFARAQEIVKNIERPEGAERFRDCLKRVIVHDDRVSIELSLNAFRSMIFGNDPKALPATQDDGERQSKADIFTVDCEFEYRSWSNELRLVIPGSARDESDRPTPLIKSIARAHLWYEQIVSGQIHSLEQLAVQAAMTPQYVSRILRHAMMSPQVVQTIVDGRRGGGTLLEHSFRNSPYDWNKQLKELR